MPEVAQRILVASAVKRLFVACLVGALALECVSVSPAQTQRENPAFEVASLKRSAKSDNPVYRNEGGPGTKSPDRWQCTSAPLSALVREVWNLHPRQLSGPPAMDTTTYDIVANVPSGASREDFKLMLRRLLIERLQLELRQERKEQNVQELTVANTGIKLKPAETAAAGTPVPSPVPRWDKDGNPQLPPGVPGAIRVGLASGIVYVGRVQSIDDLIRTLEGPVGQIIIDKTGLNGKYDYTFKFSLGAPRPLASGAATGEPVAIDPIGPSLRSALLEQLGLALQPAKATVEIVTIDRFNAEPSEN